MKDFGLYHSKTYQDGFVTVEFDGQKYYYEVRPDEAADFAKWLEMNWNSRGAIATVTGSYPNYEVRYD
jgi:hypothetical protein